MFGLIRCLVIFAMLSPALCHADGGGEVLWWLVGDDYQSIVGTAEDGTQTTAGELGVTDARLRYDAADGTSGYLTLFGVNDDGSVSKYDGSAGLGGEYGMGLPAEYFGSLTGLSGASYSFVLELGNYIDGKWARTSMESESVSYGTLLANNHITAWDSTTPLYGSPWSPSSYTVVPEPSCAMLLVMGGALLALRRRRMEA